MYLMEQVFIMICNLIIHFLDVSQFHIDLLDF